MPKVIQAPACFRIGFGSPCLHGADRSMRFALFVLFITSFALSGCLSLAPQPPEQTILAAERVELPATFIHGLPYVDLQINGKGPYRFLVDTGSGGLGVSARVAREVEIIFSKEHTILVQGSGGHSENLPIATIDRINCALFMLRGVKAHIESTETDDVFAYQGVKSFGGVIGLKPF